MRTVLRAEFKLLSSGQQSAVPEHTTRIKTKSTTYKQLGCGV